MHDDSDLFDHKQHNCKFSISGGKAVYPPTFSPGHGDILVDNVACIGNETGMVECPQLSIGHHDCSHQEDAGVLCYHSNKRCELIFITVIEINQSVPKYEFLYLKDLFS